MAMQRKSLIWQKLNINLAKELLLKRYIGTRSKEKLRIMRYCLNWPSYSTSLSSTTYANGTSRSYRVTGDLHRIMFQRKPQTWSFNPIFYFQRFSYFSLAWSRNTKGIFHELKKDFISQRLISCTSYHCAKKAQKGKTKGKKISLSMEDAEGIVDLNNLKQRMDDVLEEMSQDLATKVPLRITSGFIDNIMIDTGKGKKVPLYQLAQVKATNDSFLIEIQETFPNATKVISTAVTDTGFNMQPSIKGNTITIPIPLFTHDQRSSVERIAKEIANKAKDGLRKVRQKGMIDIRNNKEGQSKDLIRRIESQIQQLTDYYTEKVELTLEQKVKEVSKGKSK